LALKFGGNPTSVVTEEFTGDVAVVNAAKSIDFD
jgi:hypothetical protein